ncbi:MAG: methionyl-tRNA formyltransferase [Limnochordia bacterium]|jgi:methionyl-tRNA formyltransferase
MRIVFMGTPEFAVPSLEELVRRGHELALVITQPDRRAGRGQRVKFSPVKERALELGLELHQPEDVNDDATFQLLEGLSPEAIVVVAFGQRIAPRLLDLPPHGCINVHASLLPKYRGASPIQRAIMEGESITGVTIMEMDVGWDTGPILSQREVAIEEGETGQSLHDKLAQEGAQLLGETLEEIHRLAPQKQDDSLATTAPKIEKRDGLIRWSRPAIVIDRQIRALDPWPGTYTEHGGRVVKILTGEVVSASTGQPGEIIAIEGDGFTVRCGQDALLVREVQPMNKAKMKGSDYVNGYRLQIGDLLGEV